jgi:CheY-like chemotaxis protein
LDILKDARFDVLVCDIGMPGEDGYTLIRKVRALDVGHGGAVPAIALTAFARSKDRVRAMLAGYNVHVAKPVEPQELIATVAHRLRAAGSSTH